MHRMPYLTWPNPGNPTGWPESIAHVSELFICRKRCRNKRFYYQPPYLCHSSCWRHAGTSVGSSSLCGARSLNRGSCNREIASAMPFLHQGIGFARNKTLFDRQSKTRTRISAMTGDERDDCSLMICTTDILSQWNMTFWFCILFRRVL